MDHVLFLLCFGTALLTTAVSFRILMIPCSHKGHINMFSVVARAFKENGHEVDVLVMDSRRWLVDDKGVNAIPYAVVPEAKSLETDDFLENIVMVDQSKLFELFNKVTTLSSILTEGILQDQALMDKLENAHYDLAIVDGIDFTRFLYVIPYTLGIRYMTLTSRYDPWSAGVPTLPSVDHLAGISQPLTENSTMFERVKNLAMSVMFYKNMPPSVLDDSLIARYAPMRPKTTFAELFRASEMWIVNLDTVCLDWPRLQGNHFQIVAGLSLEPAKRLPEDIEAFVQGSRVGVIVLTFGSALKDVPPEMLTKMLHAFAQVEHRVLMRHTGDVDGKVPANVRMMPWLPQGDLLAHPKTKIFITHGGSNGQFEALYHGVPLITLPIFGDQYYNALRAEIKGFGVTLDKRTFTSEDLLRAIRFLSKDKQTRDKLHRCSEKLHGMPNAHDTVVFWAEHVIRFGSDHLKPISVHVPLWKMFMLDILAVFIVLILIVYTLFLFAAYKLYTRLFLPGKDALYKKSL